MIEEADAAKEAGEERTILFGLCGHGNFDLAAYDAYLGGTLEDPEFSESDLRALDALPSGAPASRTGSPRALPRGLLGRRQGDAPLTAHAVLAARDASVADRHGCDRASARATAPATLDRSLPRSGDDRAVSDDVAGPDRAGAASRSPRVREPDRAELAGGPRSVRGRAAACSRSAGLHLIHRLDDRARLRASTGGGPCGRTSSSTLKARRCGGGCTSRTGRRAGADDRDVPRLLRGQGDVPGPLAEVFGDAGLCALVYDNRNLGASDGEPRQEIEP